MVFGIWYFGIWYLVYGILVYGIWYIVFGIWYFVNGKWYNVQATETVQLTVSKFNVLNFDYERRQRRV
jgi:hypothetical protein